MKRRTLLYAGAGAAAAAAGLAWQLRQGAAPDTDLDPVTAGLWQRSFEQLDGTPLHMATLRGRPLVVNFWGTWCPPCLREMPALDRFAQQFGASGWQVLGLAIDNPRAVREFLVRQPVSYAIALAGFEGSALVRDLGNSQGGLPFTVLLDARGAVSQRKLGETDFDELVSWTKV